jgi:hypothetical protein
MQPAGRQGTGDRGQETELATGGGSEIPEASVQTPRKLQGANLVMTTGYVKDFADWQLSWHLGLCDF